MTLVAWRQSGIFMFALNILTILGRKRKYSSKDLHMWSVAFPRLLNGRRGGWGGEVGTHSLPTNYYFGLSLKLETPAKSTRSPEHSRGKGWDVETHSYVTHNYRASTITGHTIYFTKCTGH